MKIITATALILVCIAVALPCAAGETKPAESMGQKIGSAARQVVDQSKSAYHEVKKAAKETGKEIYQGAKKGVKAAKETGQEIATDVKSGFTKEDRATKTPKTSKDK